MVEHGHVVIIAGVCFVSGFLLGVLLTILMGGFEWLIAWLRGEKE